MKSYLVSQLTRLSQAGDPAGFLRQFPHPWVLWEPGTWRPPGKSGGTLMMAPPAAGTGTAGAGEALALALEGKPAAPHQVTLGRDTGCDITVNDGTLSATHLLFMRGAGDTWTVRDGGSRNGSWLDGVRLTQGRPQLLSSGARLIAGNVELTFYSAEGLLKRLRLAAAPTTPGLRLG